jgi:hypothetical protein
MSNYFGEIQTKQKELRKVAFVIWFLVFHILLGLIFLFKCLILPLVVFFRWCDYLWFVSNIEQKFHRLRRFLKNLIYH